jgi:arylsulfatase B
MNVLPRNLSKNRTKSGCWMFRFIAWACWLVLLMGVEGHRHGPRGPLGATATSCSSLQPHIVVLMMDDVGVASVGFSARMSNFSSIFFEAQYSRFTPNLDSLANTGIKLRRSYAYAECTPSRMAFLSGRFPVHNGVIMREPDRWDGGVDANAGYDGLSPNVTCFPAKLRELGYQTHIVGKLDGFGMATPQHLPIAPLRGFDSSLGYFNHANDLWNYTIGFSSTGRPPPCAPQNPHIVDLFFNKGSVKASSYYNCTFANLDRACKFEEDVFTDRALEVIESHDLRKPLFLWYSSHQAHTPFQNPDVYLERIADLCGNSSSNAEFRGQCAILERQRYLASIMQFDDNVGKLITSLKRRGMYENTLILVLADNGGPIGQSTGGNAFPLRGGKASSWEGGFRIPSCLSGGYVPSSLRGSTYEKPVAISDWYATFCQIGGGSKCSGPGADPTGELIPGIIPVESVSIWPFLMGAQSGSPHPILHLSPTVLLKEFEGGSRLYKILTAVTGYDMLTSTNYPNCSSCRVPVAACPANVTLGPCSDDPASVCCSPGDPSAPCCGFNQRPDTGNPFAPPPLARDCGHGCLFELYSDPTESRNLNVSSPEVFAEMQELLAKANQSYYEPFRGCPVPRLLCAVAVSQYDSTYGPFINVPECNSCVHTTNAYRLNPLPPVPRTTNPCQCERQQSDCVPPCSWSNDRCDLEDGRTYRDYLVSRRWDLNHFDGWASIFD